MIPSAEIDTHAVVWYLIADSRLSERAKGFIDASARAGLNVLVSPISLVEVICLWNQWCLTPLITNGG